VALKAEQTDKPPRWVLYHGTSTYRLKGILGENSLRITALGGEKISLTPERSVAEYFASNAVFGDRHDHPNEESNPVVLMLDGEGLVALLHDLEGYTGDGEEYDWENEIACWSDIDPLDEVLIDIEPVPEERSRAYFETRREAYKPRGPRLADFELAIVQHVVDRLEEGEITVDEADAIAGAINGLRVMVRSDDRTVRLSG
jgi:hypothetical protein